MPPETWVKRVFIVVSKKNRRIVQEFVEQYQANNGDITCELILQEFLGGTGHALLGLEKNLTGKSFLLLLGDEYFNDIDSFRKMKSFNKNNLILGIVAYDDLDRIMAVCNVQIKNNYVSQFVDKPTKEQIKSHWCWDGSVVLDSSIFRVLHELKDPNLLKKKDNLCLVKAMQRLVEQNHKVTVLKKKCKNINITTDLDYIEASLLEIKKIYGTNKLVVFLNSIYK